MAITQQGQTLREQLGGSPDPDFVLKLPPGWQRHTPDDDTLEAQLAALRSRMMRQHRPELYAQIAPLLRESFQKMQRQGVLAYYAPAGEAEDTTWLLGSLIATIQRAPAGQSLDGVVSQAIREEGATALLGDRRFIRYEKESVQSLQGGSLAIHAISYLTPVPQSRHRRALQFTASFGRPVEVSADDEKVSAMKMLFDTCVASLRWRPPERRAD